MKYKFIATVMILLAQLFQSGCVSQNGGKISTEGWRTVSKEDFTLHLPASMVESNVQGTDTLLNRFEDSRMTLDIECGFLASFPEYIRGQVADFQEKPIEINGGKAKLISFTEHKNGQMTKVHVLFVRGINNTEKNLLLWVTPKADTEKAIALTIFDTIKLKS